MIFSHKKIKKLAYLLIGLLIAINLSAQTNENTNWQRIQYHQQTWKVFHTSLFHIYFPTGYDSLCSFTAQQVLTAKEKTRQRMGSVQLKEPNIIIYPSLTRQYESNIGAFTPDYYTLPTLVLKGERIVLFYDGNYEDLQEQLQEAMVRLTWNKLFSEDNLTTQTKNSFIQDPIPNWYKEGTIAFFTHEWNIEQEDELKNIFQQKTPQDWQWIIANYPKLSGNAFNYFLTRQYYEQAPLQLFNQAQKKKSLPRAIKLITKKTIDSVQQQCYLFYQQRFTQETKQVQENNNIATLKIPHRKGVIKNIAVHPDKRYIAYSLSQSQERTIYIYDTQKKKTRKITNYSLPPWLAEYSKDNYPIFYWGKEQTLNILIPQEGKWMVNHYLYDGTKTGTTVIAFADQINSISELQKGNYLLTATKYGTSDIIAYNEKQRKFTPYTQDAFDDNQPTFNQNQTQLAFQSQRPTDTLKDTHGKDSILLKKGIYTAQGKKIHALLVSDSSYHTFSQPQWIGTDSLLFVNTYSGTQTISLVTNHQVWNLKEFQPFQYLPENRELLFWENKDKEIQIHIQSLNELLQTAKQEILTPSAWLQDERKRRAVKAKEDSIIQASNNQEPSFLEEVLTPKAAKEIAKKSKDSLLETLQYSPKKSIPYFLQLYSAYFTAKVNNDYFINRYQPYLNYQGQFKFPEPGAMAKGGFTDLFENYHFSIAYRLPAGGNGSDFMVQYTNTKRKKDWSIMWFRKNEQLKPDPNKNWYDPQGRPYPAAANVKTNYFEFNLKIPKDYYLTYSITQAIRYDRTIFLALEKYSLDFDDINSMWSITTFNTTWNKLKPTLPLLYQGYKLKATADLFQGFSQESNTIMALKLEAAYNQPLYRYITLAINGQAGISGGNRKILYNMGGVDNNLSIRKDSTVQFAQDAPYTFQNLVTSLRGYVQNSLYGDRFYLVNADIYFPIFQTIIPIETAYPSINQLQLGLFTDVAGAKESWNQDSVAKSIWSYGFTARTQLAGYPISFQLGYPGTFSQKPIWYVSLSVR